MNLVPLPAFTDNYIWMLHDGTHAVVVDPGDARPVQQALQQQGLTLQAILVTHHHADHTGGVDALREATGAAVYGPAGESIPQPNTPLFDGDVVNVLGLSFVAWDVPGHTAGHIAYVQQGEPDRPLLFCGDTLFSAGCGRLFEGTPQQMLESLQHLNSLPALTKVCCTHEYTLSNLRFAKAVEPGNAQVGVYTRWCEAEREQGRATLPSTLRQERQVNPFLRCVEPEVVQSALAQGATSDQPIAVFTALREWKNSFK